MPDREIVVDLQVRLVALEEHFAAGADLDVGRVVPKNVEQIVDQAIVIDVRITELDVDLVLETFALADLNAAQSSVLTQNLTNLCYELLLVEVCHVVAPLCDAFIIIRMHHKVNNKLHEIEHIICIEIFSRVVVKRTQMRDALLIRGRAHSTV